MSILPGGSGDLLGAVKRGDLDVLYTLLESGASVNASFGLYGTLLCAAIQANQSEVAQFLIDSGCDVNGADIDGEPPLCLAIRKGHANLVEMVAAAEGCKLNCVDPVSRNPALCVAVTHGTSATVRTLVEAGANIAKPGAGSNTPFHLAVQHQCPDVVPILLQGRSGDVNTANESGKSALHLAAEQEDPLMLRVLLEKCPRIDRREGNDRLDVHRGLDIDLQAVFDGNTALHLAILNRNYLSAKLLMDAGCDVHLENSSVQTPLFLACAANSEALVADLLRAGADPNRVARVTKQFHVRSKTGCQTALHMAIRRGALGVVRRLVDAGADLNCRAAGNYPLIQALIEDKPDIVDYFLDEGPRRGLDVSTVDGSGGQNALGAVDCCRNVRELTQRLITLGCGVNRPHDDRLPLEYAVDFDCTEAVEVLIDHGADVNTTVDGLSLLQHCVVDGKSDDLLHLLLFYGADIYVTNDEGQSLVELALENDHALLVKYLVAVGYNLSSDGFLARWRPGSTLAARQEEGESLDEQSLLSDCEPESDDKSDTDGSVDSRAELCQWLAGCAAVPIKLQAQCRTVIRKHFVDSGTHMKRITELPLPAKMLDYLMLKTLFREVLSL